MSEWHATGHRDGSITFGPIIGADFRQYAKENAPMRLIVKHEEPEKGNMRRFYFAAVLPLWAYLDGKNYRKRQVIEDLHEIAKVEFNGELIVVNGEMRRVGRTSKGLDLKPFVNRVIDSLEEQYGIERQRLLDPELYKKWRDTIFPSGGPETFIDYMVEIGRLKAINTTA